jgi:CysZ protein
MIAAALLALREAFSPPFRSVLLKSVGLALLLLVLLGVLLETVVAKLIDLESTTWDFLATLLSGLGVVVALVFLVPPVVSLVAGFFQDRVAELVEKSHYPADAPGREMPAGRSIFLALRFALLVLGVNVVALFLLLVPGVNIIAWWLANGYLLGREYFEFAAMRFMPEEEAKALRRAHRGRVFVGGLMIAAFMAVPILNLATPLVASAFMVHIFKGLASKRAASRGLHRA